MKHLRSHANTIADMKTIILVLGAILFLAVTHGVQEVVVEDVIAHGPKAGQKVRIVKTEAWPKEVGPSAKESIMTLSGQAQMTNAPVELLAYRHQAVRVLGTNSWPFVCYEFQVRAKGSQGFVWSCWTPDFPRPHRFRVMTTQSGKSYAGYIRGGVHLYLLSQSRESDSMRRQFLGVPIGELNHPDALPVLPIDQIQEYLGWTNTLGLGPQTWNVTVDSVSDSNGELRVTVQGAAPQPQCTFALRKEKWELVSTSGK